MLTRPYRIRGTVIHGAGRGVQLGYPTANLAGVRTLLPCEGIYAGRAWADGSAWPAAISLGPNPTFDEGGLKIEAHLIGYRGSLYDRPLEVDFLARLRGVEKFSSVDQLIAQMRDDVAATRAVVENEGAQMRSKIESVVVGFKGNPTVEEFWGFLKGESPRCVAIVSAAFFDETLGRLLGDTRGRRFRDRIDEAAEFGLLTDNERHDLHVLRELRNDFAHDLRTNAFDAKQGRRSTR